MSKNLQYLLFLFLTIISVGLFYYLASEVYVTFQTNHSFWGFLKGKRPTFNTNLFIQLSSAFALYSIFMLRYLRNHLLTAEQFILGIVLLASIILFVLGINIELVKTQKFLFFSDDITLLPAIQALFIGREKDYFLGMVMLLFTIIFPSIKYLLLSYGVFNKNATNSSMTLLNNIAKWSMLDVFIVAMIVFTMKFKHDLLQVSVQDGAFYFAIAVISAQIVALLLQREKTEQLT